MGSINVNNLAFSYQKNVPVFSNISWQASGQESIGIIGPNGAGKSTLLKLLTGLEFAVEGFIEIDDELLTKKNVSDIRKKEGYVFQDSDSQLFMGTVYEDVAFAPRNYGFSEEEVQKRCERALKMTHMTELKDRQIYKLSGGQKKLASIATILSVDPEIILMDEPSVALDPVNRERLIEIVNNLPGIKLIASHDLDFIYDTCERTLVLYQGEIAYDGDTKALLKNKALLEQFGLKLPLSFRFMEG